MHGLHGAEAVQVLQEHLYNVESLKSSNRLATPDAVHKESPTLLSAPLESLTHNDLEKLRKQPVLKQRRKLLQVITGNFHHLEVRLFWNKTLFNMNHHMDVS